MSSVAVVVLAAPAPDAPRQVVAGRRRDARRLRQVRQERFVACAPVASHDAAQRRAGFERGAIDADRRAAHQAGIGQWLQDPGEDGVVRVDVDQAARARQRRVAGGASCARGRCAGSASPRHARRSRARNRGPRSSRSAASGSSGQAPGRGVRPSRRSARTGPRRSRQRPHRPESVQAHVERMARAPRQARVATHIDGCFGRRGRLPMAMAAVYTQDASVTLSIRFSTTVTGPSALLATGGHGSPGRPCPAPTCRTSRRCGGAARRGGRACPNARVRGSRRGNGPSPYRLSCT